MLLIHLQNIAGAPGHHQPHRLAPDHLLQPGLVDLRHQLITDHSIMRAESEAGGDNDILDTEQQSAELSVCVLVDQSL